MLSPIIVLATLLTGCGQGRDAESPARPPIESKPLADAETLDGPLFELLPPEKTAIDFTVRWDKPSKYDRILFLLNTSGSVAVGDYDADGRPDILFTSPTGGCRLYRNLGDFRFADVTGSSGIKDESFWSTGATFVDIDNDEDLDIYVCGYESKNRLYVNQGDGTFLERASAFGLDYEGASTMMAFADYDRDGDLDGYLLTTGLMPPPNTKFRVRFEGDKPVVADEVREYWNLLYLPGERAKRIEAAQFDHLFRNDGPDDDGQVRFTDVSRESGIDGTDFGLGVVWWDYNHDGWPDIYVANDYYGPDYLYRNNKDGTFTDVKQSALPHTPWFSMGVDIGDINGDGMLDLLATDMSGSTHYKQKMGMGDMSDLGWFLEYAEPRQYMRNALYVNTGTGRFLEAAYLAGVADTDWTWTPRLADLDNDGRLDLFVTNGWVRDYNNSDLAAQARRLGEGSPASFAFWKQQPMKKDQNFAFRNSGALKFEDVSAQWGLNREGVSFGAATSDLDGDGDLDLIVSNMDQQASIYRNNGGAGRRVKVRLRGRRSNRHGIGATVRLQTSGGTQVRYLTLARGWASCSEPMVHFGLGEARQIDKLTVDWPSGHVQVFEDLAADHFYTVNEPNNEAENRDPAAELPTLYVRSDAFKGVRHTETPFDDFQREPLLPNKLSQLGPGLAIADIDGDGDEDCYLGGASGHPGQLLINQGNGQWSARTLADARPEREEMGALFFDVDSDGDQDLYLVSGGVEVNESSQADNDVLQDRILLNDGKGRFVAAPTGALPNAGVSGSVVAAADFDRDGDLDLFVGGRTVPGRYPETPTSRVLRNDAGKLVDVGGQSAPGLEGSGLVTSALWSDADGDGWIDLLVTHEWGPVAYWRNDKGTLVNRTRQAGLAERLGWWNGIAGRDVDHDGDIDYVVTNFGLNTKYHPTAAKPVRIYYADFDNSGRKQIVEAKVGKEAVFPIRGRSCSSDAMPFLSNKFKTYHEFAIASLPEIYSESRLAQALKREVNTLESGVLLNDGKGTFTFSPLPRLAQVSPGFGIALTEVDGDGNPDAYIVQNFYSPQRETGRMAGGMSLLLKGNGDGTFEPVWPAESGLIVPGDAKSLATADLNDDGRPDFVVGVNDGSLLAFENQSSPGIPILVVRLVGRAGNPTAVGTRVTVNLEDGDSQTAEVHAGGSYLTQSTSALVFGLGTQESVKQIDVRWPDGTNSVQRLLDDQRFVTLKQPN